jgi:sulfite oxidase
MPFGKPPDTVVHGEEPFNAEPPAPALAQAPITPLERFYVRNHGPVPDTHDGWRLRVDGLVERPLTLSLQELRYRFPATELTATLQCAGNRRAGLIAVRDIPGEAPWGPGATGTAVWRGVRLRDVLEAAGAHGAHVAFDGADRSEEADPPQCFAGSIPREKAEREEVLVAFDMNGAPLPPVHGAPLRVVVPGYIGARSVKWLTRIELRDAASDGYYQATAYRLLHPDEAPGVGVGVELGEVALNADVLSHADGSRVAAGPVELRGYAFAGGDRHVVRVEISADDGASWHDAELLEDLGRWAWRLWRLCVDLPPGEHTILTRAWDSAAATQPEHAETVWNPKGYVNSAWGRTRLLAGPPPAGR